MVPKSNDDFFFVRGDAVDAVPGRFHPTTFKTTNTTTTACPPFFSKTTTTTSRQSDDFGQHHDQRRSVFLVVVVRAKKRLPPPPPPPPPRSPHFLSLFSSSSSSSSSLSSSFPVIRVPLFFRVVCETQIREHLTKGVVVVQMCETTTYDDEHRQKTHKNTLCTRLL